MRSSWEVCADVFGGLEKGGAWDSVVDSQLAAARPRVVLISSIRTSLFLSGIDLRYRLGRDVIPATHVAMPGVSAFAPVVRQQGDKAQAWRA
jgi:hypothetical protein